MRNTWQLSMIARDAGIVETKSIPILQQPPGPVSLAVSDDDVATAKKILIYQRTQDESWKDPAKQKRRFLRTKKKNETLANPEKWTFSRAERYEALDEYIRGLGSLGIAQAILDLNTPGEVLDVNLKYYPIEEKRDYEENDWLEFVAGRGSLEYVTFLASCGTRQSAKDKALAIALQREDMPMIRELLLYHANPNNGLENDYFIPAVVQGNFELVRLFLSAPNPLTDAAMNIALLRAVEQGHSHLVSLLVAHGADANYERGSALDAAVLNGSLSDLSSICLKSQRALLSAAFDNAVSTACTIQDEALRDTFVDLLLCAGADADHSALADLLVDAVKTGRKSTVSLLIKHGTSPDSRNAECLKEAVQSMQLDLVEILLQSRISASGMHRALESIPDEASENEVRDITMLLLNKGVAQETLSLCLARAVTKGFDIFAVTLVQRGAPLDYDDAACVRHTLRQQNFNLLESLLKAPCVPETLGNAIPEAMAITAISVRRSAMYLLLKKGAKGKALHRALRTVIAEDNPLGTDYELADLLIRHKASVDFIGSSGNDNVLQIATARSDLRAVELLCRAKPSAETTSAALPFVFKSYTTSVENAATYDILSVLLRHEVHTQALSEALVDAVSHDSQERIIALLLENGANANYKDGKGVEYALALPDPTVLRVICEKGSLEPNTLARLVPHALDARSYSIDKVGPLLRCCAEYRSILDTALLLEVESMGCRHEVIHILLGLDASVDYKDAAALCNVVGNNDLGTTRLLLSKKPDIKHYLNLLQIAAKRPGSKQERHDMMRLLLSQCGPGAGQDEVLMQLVQADEDDLSCIKLLLDKGASIDHQDGALIQTAIIRSRLQLFDLFMSKGPNHTSVAKGFEAARRNALLSTQERLHIFNALIKAGFGGLGDSDPLSLAVVEAVERDPLDTTIPELLLNHGATVEYDQGHALQSAVLSTSPVLVKLLLDQHPSNQTVNRVFGKMISAGTISLPGGGFKVGQLLLESGRVQKSLINNALSQLFTAASTATTGYISKKEVELFLSHGADVNAADGTYFLQAIRKEDMELFRMLLARGKPDPLVIIPTLIPSVAPEKVLVKYLRVLIKNVASPVPIAHATLLMAIERFPRGEELVRLLLECDPSLASSTTSATINPALGIENVNVMLWALLRENPRVSDDVIVAILQAGSVKDSVFVTSKTRLSGTILAAKYWRHAVMRELISQKANVSSRDVQNRSALFYASRNGDVEMVRILNKAGALPDDGSLHEAAREVHPQLVSLLLSAGHDSSFPSLLHSDSEGLGRTPLEELCLRAARKPSDDDDVTWSTRLRETLQILLRGFNGKEIKKDGGAHNNKSIVHLAIDNAKNPAEVLEALLEFPQIWKFINEPVHQFEDPEGFVYSPTKYVEYFHRGPKTVGKELTRLLRGKRCQDRYYSPRGYEDQPENAVGLPEDIAAEIHKRKLLELERKQEMARIEEMAAHQRDVRMKDHQFELQISDERHQQTMKHTQERDTYDQNTIRNKHTLMLMNEQALNQQRRDQMEEDNKLKLRLLNDESIQQESLLAVRRDKEIQYKNRLLIQEREAEEAKMGYQKQLMWERDKVEEKQHGRQILFLKHQDEINGKQHQRHVSLLDRQDQSVKARAVEMRSIADAARAANMPPHTANMLQLEGPD